MSGLREFILKRQAEIRAEGTPLWERKEVVEAEFKLLEAKIAKLSEEWGELQKALEAIGAEEAKASQAMPSKPEMTIKEAILAVLEKRPRGLNSAAILEEINTQFFDGKIRRTSFSPQLSRLKADADVLLRGSDYFLNLEKHESPASAGPSFVSPPEGCAS